MTEPTGASTGQEPGTDDTDVITGNTHESINANLDDIDDIKVLRKMVRNGRAEAAKHRKEKSEIAAAKAELEKVRQSEMSEFEKLADRVKKSEAATEALHVSNLKLKYDVDDDLVEFIGGGTPEEMEARAAKLGKRSAETRGTKQVLPSNAGKPGNHVGAGGDGKSVQTGGEFLKSMMG